MKLQRVASSSIEAAGYESRSRTLLIQFRHGGIYAYYDVPRRIYTAFLGARSRGRFFTRHIRGQFDYRPLGNRKIQKTNADFPTPKPKIQNKRNLRVDVAS